MTAPPGPDRGVTVVIPTYNRREILLRCLAALEAQSLPHEEMEIVVVDDGSGDGSPGAARDFLRSRLPRWQVLVGPNRGPAHARNRGMVAATAARILLLGDDMIAAPDLLERHLGWHSDHPEPETAVLGHVTWHPDLEVTPFMEWLDKEDLQFAFHRLRHGDPVDFWHFYSCNVSFNRRFLEGYPMFDTDFPYAAYEDIEFGHRLQDRGLRLLYNRDAAVYHLHSMTPDSFWRRMERVGESAVIFNRKIPDLLPPVPRRSHRRVSPRNALVLGLYPILDRLLPPAARVLRPRYYRTRARLAYRRGWARGWSKAAARSS